MSVKRRPFSVPAVPEAPRIPTLPPIAAPLEEKPAEQPEWLVPDEPEPFTIKPWGNHANYCCNYCDEAFVDANPAFSEMAAWLHYRDWHNNIGLDGAVTRERRAVTVTELEEAKRVAADTLRRK